MKSIDEALTQMVEAIQNSEEYLEYHKELAKVKGVDGLKEKIDEFRLQNYALQTSKDYDLLKMEEFERKYENFREDPLVSDFLAAELAFCRMIQEMNIRITEAFNFE